MDHTSASGFTRVITHAGCWENTKKGSVVDHDLMASDLCKKSFRRGLAVAFSHRQLLLDSLDFYSLGVFLF